MSDRKRFYRIAFCVNDVPQGTMLICDRSVEMVISKAAHTVGKGFSVHSVNPIFFSDEEENDFLHFIVAGNPAFKENLVDIEKRMRGV